MTLTDPRDGLAEQSNFVSYLMGLANLTRMVHALAADCERRTDPPRDADHLIYVLLGLARLGDGIERLAKSAAAAPQQRAAAASALPETRWLR